MKLKVESKIGEETESDLKSTIVFREGIPGFPAVTRYFLIAYEKSQSFFRLQAVDEAELGFVVIDPLLFLPDYHPKFSKSDLQSLEITDPESMVILSIVSVPQDNPQKMTANLMAPLLINSHLRLGKQIVLSNSAYAIREPIIKAA